MQNFHKTIFPLRQQQQQQQLETIIPQKKLSLINSPVFRRSLDTKDIGQGHTHK